MTDKNIKYKRETRAFLQPLTKEVSNSVYGTCIRKDNEESYKCVTQSWMKNENDDSVEKWFPLKNGNVMVTKDKEGVDAELISKKVISQPCHLGCFMICHSKPLMKNVNLAVDGLKNTKTYYGDTDSMFIHNSDYEILKTKGLIGKNLFQSRNDYGNGGILYGLLLAPNIESLFLKIVYYQKTTSNGFDQNLVGLNFKDFFGLERGENLLGKSKLKWRRDLPCVKIRHRVFQCPQCDNDKICKQCEISPKMK